ncbi:MAG: winged helix-turn-helix domain-containing protein [Nanoarchaeota archaeon]|nr:winged helix-turn-helix domain-containing protein [Nanoarchaeota archaeon]
MPDLINKSQIKIVNEVFRNPGINLREIIFKTRLSPNYVLKYVNHLVKLGILKEEKLEKKRVYLRRFFLNFDSNITRNFFSLVKEEQKEDFFQEYPKLRSVFNQLIQEIKTLDFILVYGSYARFASTKNSDIDILIVGNIKNKECIREILISLDIEPSIKIETLNSFEKRKHDALHQQILKDNVLIYDAGRFIKELE